MNKITVQHLAGATAGRSQAYPAAFYRSLLIGRDPICEIDFADDRRVSRSHALIEWDDAAGAGLRVQDLDSTNGTYRNGQRVTDAVFLEPGDVIRLGRRGPEFMVAVEPAAQRALDVTEFQPLVGVTASP